VIAWPCLKIEKRRPAGAAAPARAALFEGEHAGDARPQELVAPRLDDEPGGDAFADGIGDGAEVGISGPHDARRRRMQVARARNSMPFISAMCWLAMTRSILFLARISNPSPASLAENIR